MAADRLQARARDRLAQLVDVQGLELVGDRRRSDAADRGEQVLVGEREDLAKPVALVARDLDRSGQSSHEPRPGEARATRGLVL
jgi:hypothetical protein